MSTSPEFRRIIRVRSFLTPSLIPASLSGLLSGIALAVLLSSVGLLAWLLMQPSLPSTSGESASADAGLQPLAQALEADSIGRFFPPIFSKPYFSTNASSAVLLLAIMTLCLAVRGLLQSATCTLVANHVAAAVARLRQHIHRKAIRLEPGDFAGEQARVSDRLFQSDASVLESAATRWGSLWLIDAPDLVVAVLISLFIDPKVAVQVILPIFLGRFLIRAETQRSDASLRLLTDQVHRGLTRMAESLRKTRIVTSFGMEKAEHQHFENHLNEYRQRCRLLNWQQKIGQGTRSLIQLAMILIPATLLVIHVLRGGHPAAAIVLLGCVLVVWRTLQNLETLPTVAVEGSERAEEIAVYLNRIPSVSQTPGASFQQPMSKTLTFNQISFQTSQFPGLVHGLDLRIGFGERLALLSLQPSAAYALASMIPRFVDPDLGQVLIDGQDIRQATLESLRAEAIFVGGHDPVFNASVLENITCGQADISRQQALEAAKLVHADNFIRNLPKGYETLLGEHGVTLDPGQIFRLSLARAVVRQPALLVIEEPATPMDAETKAMLDDAYQRVCVNRTVIFLPHRLSTVKKCSRIVLVHDGRIAVDGVHEQLVRNSELYRHWEYIRFNPFRDEAEGL